MAGDWIKMRSGLDRDQKVLFMADELVDNKDYCYWLANYTNQNVETAVSVMPIEVTRDIVIASLLRVWSVALERGKRCKRKKSDLILTECNDRIIDSISMVPGFAQAMASVGWLVHEPDSDRKTVRFPNLLEENTPANEWGIEKKKEQSRRSSARYRGKKSDTKVTRGDTESDTVGDEKVTPRREEIRRDKSIKEKEKKETQPDGSSPPIPKEDELDFLIDSWNELPKGIAPRVESRRSVPIVKGWKKVQKEPELKAAFADIPHLMSKIRYGRLLHGQGWFRFPWLFAKGKTEEWNVLKILDGDRYRGDDHAQQRDPARVRSSPDSHELFK